MKKVSVKLTEADWEHVFRIRCRSKSGSQPSSEERRLLERAYKEDSDRYKSLDTAVFEQTKPFGAR